MKNKILALIGTIFVAITLSGCLGIGYNSGFCENCGYKNDGFCGNPKTIYKYRYFISHLYDQGLHNEDINLMIRLNREKAKLNNANKGF